MGSWMLRLRAVVALVLVAAFYAIALACVAGLSFASWEVAHFTAQVRGRGILWVGLAALALFAAAIIVAWSIIPRRDRFAPPGPELLRSEHPQLFKEIQRVAQMVGEREPMHTYLVPEVNAFVTERGGFMGFFGTRVMGLGLGLLSTLTVAELRSVIAHEFGHFAGGDVKLLPWIGKARAAMIRTVSNLAKSIETGSGELGLVVLIFWLVRAPFEAFARFFIRFTQSLSRAQEIAADSMAIAVAGSKTHARALATVNRAGLVFGAYFREDVEPLMAVGRLPPLAVGFTRFLSSGLVSRAFEHIQSTEPGPADPYDSHPPLHERLAHAARLDTVVVARKNDSEPALTLLSDVAGCELALANFVTDNTLERVSWEASGAHLVKLWRHDFARYGKNWGSMPVLTLPNNLDSISGLLRGTVMAAAPADQMMRIASRVTFLGTALTLVDRGFEVRNQPGETISFVRGDVTLDPSPVISDFFSSTNGRAAWEAFWKRAEMSDAAFPQVA
jgi:Zn-dependent protease with chaperone function